jgi:hypothetical protein
MPKDTNELKILYVGMLKHIFGNFNIINSVKKKNSKNKNNTITTYELNKELINTLFKLVFVKFHKELDNDFLNSIGIKNPNLSEDNEDIEDKQKNAYKFKGAKHYI